MRKKIIAMLMVCSMFAGSFASAVPAAASETDESVADAQNEEIVIDDTDTENGMDLEDASQSVSAENTDENITNTDEDITNTEETGSGESDDSQSEDTEVAAASVTIPDYGTDPNVTSIDEEALEQYLGEDGVLNFTLDYMGCSSVEVNGYEFYLSPIHHGDSDRISYYDGKESRTALLGFEIYVKDGDDQVSLAYIAYDDADYLNWAYIDAEHDSEISGKPVEPGYYYLELSGNGRTSNHICFQNEKTRVDMWCDIKKFPLTTNGTAAADKIYDGNTECKLDLSSVQLQADESNLNSSIWKTNHTDDDKDFSFIEQEDISLNCNTQASFEDANAGTDKPISYGETTWTLEGEDADHFTLEADDSVLPSTGAISPKPVSLNWSDTTAYYDGSKHSPTVSMDTSAVISGDLCSAVMSEEDFQSEVGEYSIRAELTGEDSSNYALNEETSTCSYRILPGVLKAEDVTLSQSSYSYSGKQHKPAVTVVKNAIALTEEDYSVSYRNNVNTGTASVVIQGKGNYTGTVKKNFKITENTKRNTSLLNKHLSAVLSGNTLKMTWGKVATAKGYEVYESYCGQKLKKVKTTSATSFSIGKCSDKLCYKFYVKAYRYQDGKKLYIGESSVAHVAGKNAIIYTNTKSITVSKTSIILKKGKTARLKVSSTLADKTKKVLNHVAAYRYFSMDPFVATVSSKGLITAKSAGSCTIYVMAPNGKKTAVKVTVK